MIFIAQSVYGVLESLGFGAVALFRVDTDGRDVLVIVCETPKDVVRLGQELLKVGQLVKDDKWVEVTAYEQKLSDEFGTSVYPVDFHLAKKVYPSPSWVRTLASLRAIEESGCCLLDEVSGSQIGWRAIDNGSDSGHTDLENRGGATFCY